MTIAALDTKDLFLGDGASVAFSFDFKVDSGADLLVFLTAADGTETALVLDTDYTVVLNASQNSNPGGIVTFTAAPAAGTPIVIMRGVDFIRGTEFTDSVPPHIIESELDRLTMYAQQLKERLDRSLHVSAAVQVPAQLNFKNAVARAGAVVGFDDEGQGALYTFESGSLVGPAGAVYASRVTFSAPAVFRQAANGDWSHTEVDLVFTWMANGSVIATRELTVTIDDNAGEFDDPGLTEPGDDFTSTLATGNQLLSITSEYNGQREYAELAILALPSDEAFVTDDFAPTWTSGDFTGGDPSGAITYANRAGMVTLLIEAALTGESNAGTMTWDAGSLPAEIRPSQPRSVVCVLQYDDSTEVQGQALFNPDGSAEFTVHTVDGTVVDTAGAFQTGEDKGLPEHWNVVYPL